MPVSLYTLCLTKTKTNQDPLIHGFRKSEFLERNFTSALSLIAQTYPKGHSEVERSTFPLSLKWQPKLISQPLKYQNFQNMEVDTPSSPNLSPVSTDRQHDDINTSSCLMVRCNTNSYRPMVTDIILYMSYSKARLWLMLTLFSPFLLAGQNWKLVLS